MDKGQTPAWDVTREYVWAEGRLIGLLDYGYAKADPFDMASDFPEKPVVYQVAALSLLAVPGLFLIFGVRRRGQKGYVAYVTFGALFASSFLIANAIPICCPAPGTASIHPYFVLTGHLGQPLKVVDDLYNTKWQTWYTPFGNTMDLQEDGVELNFRLPGQYFDGEISDYLGTEVYYNWHRYYMPGVGRYLQVDPIQQSKYFISDNLNSFNYVNSQAMTKTDATGLLDCGYAMDYCKEKARKCSEKGRKAVNKADERGYTHGCDKGMKDCAQHKIGPGIPNPMIVGSDNPSCKNHPDKGRWGQCWEYYHELGHVQNNFWSEKQANNFADDVASEAEAKCPKVSDPQYGLNDDC